MEDLPLELLTRCLKYSTAYGLEEPETMQVCQRWKKAMLASPECWDKLVCDLDFTERKGGRAEWSFSASASGMVTDGEETFANSRANDEKGVSNSSELNIPPFTTPTVVSHTTALASKPKPKPSIHPLLTKLLTRLLLSKARPIDLSLSFPSSTTRDADLMENIARVFLLLQTPNNNIINGGSAPNLAPVVLGSGGCSNGGGGGGNGGRLRRYAEHGHEGIFLRVLPSLNEKRYDSLTELRINPPHELVSFSEERTFIFPNLKTLYLHEVEPLPLLRHLDISRLKKLIIVFTLPTSTSFFSLVDTLSKCFPTLEDLTLDMNFVMDRQSLAFSQISSITHPGVRKLSIGGSLLTHVPGEGLKLSHLLSAFPNTNELVFGNHTVLDYTPPPPYPTLVSAPHSTSSSSSSLSMEKITSLRIMDIPYDITLPLSSTRTDRLRAFVASLTNLRYLHLGAKMVVSEDDGDEMGDSFEWPNRPDHGPSRRRSHYSKTGDRSSRRRFTGHGAMIHFLKLLISYPPSSSSSSSLSSAKEIYCPNLELIKLESLSLRPALVHFLWRVLATRSPSSSYHSISSTGKGSEETYVTVDPESPRPTVEFSDCVFGSEEWKIEDCVARDEREFEAICPMDCSVL